jgi:hypothetical protein
MSRQTSSFSPEDRKKILESHLNIGQQKAVSYLPINTIENTLNLSIDEYVTMIEERGHSAIVLGPQECCIKSGAVYAYNCMALGDILRDNNEILMQHGLTTKSDDFIKKIAAEWQDRDSALYQVIKRAFGD